MQLDRTQFVTPLPAAPEVESFLAVARRTPICSVLCALAVALSVAGWSEWGADLWMDVRGFEREPWRLLSGAFVHRDVLHLFLDLGGIWFLGRACEQRCGRARFVALLIVLWFGSALALRGLARDASGLTGVVGGLWTFVLVAARRDERFAGLPGSRSARLLAECFVLSLVLDCTGVWSGCTMPFLVGAALGACAALAVASRRIALGTRLAIVLGWGALLGLAVEIRRPGIRSELLGGDERLLGNLALDEGDWSGARAHFERALEVDPRDLDSRWSLGSAQWKLGYHDQAVDSLVRAYEASLGNPCAGCIVKIEDDQWSSLRRALVWTHREALEAGRALRVDELEHAVQACTPSCVTCWREQRAIAQELGDHVLVEQADARLAGLRSAR